MVFGELHQNLPGFDRQVSDFLAALQFLLGAEPIPGVHVGRQFRKFVLTYLSEHQVVLTDISDPGEELGQHIIIVSLPAFGLLLISLSSCVTQLIE